jgi:hypothetical protein
MPSPRIDRSSVADLRPFDNLKVHMPATILTSKGRALFNRSLSLNPEKTRNDYEHDPDLGLIPLFGFARPRLQTWGHVATDIILLPFSYCRENVHENHPFKST